MVAVGAAAADVAAADAVAVEEAGDSERSMEKRL
jgi:hypothetical protein